MNINLNDVLLKHWILFDFNTKDAFGFLDPHYLFTIENSIHYKALESDDYVAYNTLIKTTKQQEHSENKFKKLKENFNLCKMTKIKVYYHRGLDKFIVNDGCHRLAIIKYNNLYKNNLISKELFLIDE